MILDASSTDQDSLLTESDHVITVGKLIKMIKPNINNRGRQHLIIEGISKKTLKVYVTCGKWWQVIRREWLSCCEYNFAVHDKKAVGPTKFMFVEVAGFILPDTNFENNYTSIKMYNIKMMIDHMHSGFDPQIWCEAVVAKFISLPYLTLSTPHFLAKEPQEKKIKFAKKWNRWYDEASKYYDIRKKQEIQIWAQNATYYKLKELKKSDTKKSNNHNDNDFLIQ